MSPLTVSDEKCTRQGRQRRRWEDNFREWTGPQVGKSQTAVENRKEKNGGNWL